MLSSSGTQIDLFSIILKPKSAAILNPASLSWGYPLDSDQGDLWVIQGHVSWAEGTWSISKPICASFFLTCLLTKVEWRHNLFFVHSAHSKAQCTKVAAAVQAREIHVTANCFFKYSMWFILLNIYPNLPLGFVSVTQQWWCCQNVCSVPISPHCFPSYHKWARFISIFSLQRQYLAKATFRRKGYFGS